MTSTEATPKKPKETPLCGDEIKVAKALPFEATPKKRKAGDDGPGDTAAVQPTPKKSKENDEGPALPVEATPKTKTVEPKTPKTASRSRGAAPAEFKMPRAKSKEAPGSPSADDDSTTKNAKDCEEDKQKATAEAAPKAKAAKPEQKTASKSKGAAPGSLPAEAKPDDEKPKAPVESTPKKAEPKTASKSKGAAPGSVPAEAKPDDEKPKAAIEATPKKAEPKAVSFKPEPRTASKSKGAAPGSPPAEAEPKATKEEAPKALKSPSSPNREDSPTKRARSPAAAAGEESPTKRRAGSPVPGDKMKKLRSPPRSPDSPPKRARSPAPAATPADEKLKKLPRGRTPLPERKPPPPPRKLQRPKETVGKPWPKGELQAFMCNEDIDWGPLLKAVLLERGWTVEEPCHAKLEKERWTVFIREFEATLMEKTPVEAFGKEGQGSDGVYDEGYRLRTLPLPPHALWMMSFAKYRLPATGNDGKCFFREEFLLSLLEHGQHLGQQFPGNYRMAKFGGMEPATYKTNLSKAFRDKDWYPIGYILPNEKEALLKAMKEGGDDPSNLWIAKPKNDYAGSGIKVWHGTNKELIEAVEVCEQDSRSVVQKYLANPLLIGEYKFHMRIHLLITSLDPPEAFVQQNGQCLFATKPYTLDRSTLDDKFDPPVHVTNMGLNATPENKEDFFREKPHIGKGQQIRIKEMEQYLKDNHPKYDHTALWEQITSIAEDTVRYIAKAPSVKRHAKKYLPQGHFEIMGMDLMLDNDLKVYMCEVNADPGLDYPDKEVLGEPNPDYKKEDAACTETWHDILTLLGFDKDSDGKLKGKLNNWYKIDFGNGK